jgi:hypothetical protein
VAEVRCSLVQTPGLNLVPGVTIQAMFQPFRLTKKGVGICRGGRKEGVRGMGGARRGEQSRTCGEGGGCGNIGLWGTGECGGMDSSLTSLRYDCWKGVRILLHISWCKLLHVIAKKGTGDYRIENCALFLKAFMMFSVGWPIIDLT